MTKHCVYLLVVTIIFLFGLVLYRNLDTIWHGYSCPPCLESAGYTQGYKTHLKVPFDGQYLGSNQWSSCPEEATAKVTQGTNSAEFWENRYANNGNSGSGSYGGIAQFKARILNEFVRINRVQHVVEFGFGDGNQLSLATYPSYTGFDVSYTVWKKTKARFAEDKTKTFLLYDHGPIPGLQADMTISLDVIYHLVEDKVFEDYMRSLFEGSKRFVVIFSSNCNAPYGGSHVRHRRWSSWVEENQHGWHLAGSIKTPTTGTSADFFFYVKNN